MKHQNVLLGTTMNHYISVRVVGGHASGISSIPVITHSEK
jgi:hypothetical protein